MSYCVNCGVELDESQRLCPLCHVPVQNPVSPWREPPVGPYPRLVETIMHSIDRRYGALLATIALAIPVVCSILIDVLITHRLSWSGYVTGGALCLFVWILLPQILKKVHVYLHILYNWGILVAYLGAIFYMAGNVRAYLLLAAPLTVAAMGYAYAVTPVIRSRRLRGSLYKPAVIVFITAALPVAVQTIIDFYVKGIFMPDWSLIAAAPCLVIGVILIVLERKKKVKDMIIRRLFM